MTGETAPIDATPQDMDSFMEAAFDDIASEESPPVEASEPVVEQEPVEATESEPAEEADTETDVVDETAEAEPVEEQTIEPPASMSAKDRERFNALPPEDQKWISDRAKQQEADYTKKTMELADQRKAFDKLEQVIGPRRQQLAMDGMDESAAIGQLFALSDFANQDPVGFVKYLFNARQIPLSALTEQGMSEQTADPQLAAMQQKLQGFESFLTQQQMQQQHQAETAINSDIEAFSQENEFYSELESEMIPIVSALKGSDPSMSNKDALAKAYKMAMATNEGVQAKVEAAKAAKAEAEKKDQARKAANKAKRAGAANVTKSGALPPGAAKAENVEDFIGGLVDERMSA